MSYWTDSTCERLVTWRHMLSSGDHTFGGPGVREWI
jgi:hypothetical protein